MPRSTLERLIDEMLGVDLGYEVVVQRYVAISNIVCQSLAHEQMVADDDKKELVRFLMWYGHVITEQLKVKPHE